MLMQLYKIPFWLDILDTLLLSFALSPHCHHCLHLQLSIEWDLLLSTIEPHNIFLLSPLFHHSCFSHFTFICHHFMCSTKQLLSLMQFSSLSHQDLCHQHEVYYDFFSSLSPSIL